jgi:hypothetical protein
MNHRMNKIYDNDKNLFVPKMTNMKTVMVKIVYDPGVTTKIDIIEHIDHRMRGILKVEESVDVIGIMKKVREEQMNDPFAASISGD